jgi:drug/metabolite transporter (DMT)-like permease
VYNGRHAPDAHEPPPFGRPPSLTLRSQVQHARLAFALALLAALFWGLLPLALWLLTPALDAFTITWCRFLFAAVIVGALLGRRGALPRPWRLAAPLPALLLAAIIGVTSNYVLFVIGMSFTSPAVAQVVTQLASLFLLLGGIVIFGERFSRLQWFGFAILLVGLVLFFNRRLPLLFGVRAREGFGVLLLLIGALTWACYGLAQKRLLRELSSPQTLWLLYIGGALLLTPLVHPARLLSLSHVQAWALVFCCFNTLIAYGAYAEAMKLGEVARIGATVTISPLFTLLGGILAPSWLPAYAATEAPGALMVLGACAVVAGSALCALGSDRAAI